MPYFDVFNGDADGLCALVQLRREEPRDATLVTGVKRDISLLKQVQPAAGDVITVLDVSMDKNKADLQRILAAGCPVFYCDHHVAGDIPDHPQLTALINTDANVCTSLLVNGHLKGRFALWAIVGAFGDNLDASAEAVARTQQLTAGQLQQLKSLGIYINYNGYGASLDDLHFRPAELYRELAQYDSPLDFMQHNKAVFDRLADGYRDDMAKAASLEPIQALAHAAVYMMPNQPWASRVSGVYSNDLANHAPDRAHAVLTELGDGDYLVSVRAPLNNKQGAADICQQFATGGGRAAAAGINRLPAAELQRFIDVFSRYYA
ncbi:MAG TPA: DHH family phosphoesterase [Pseudomonadales bacterium]